MCNLLLLHPPLHFRFPSLPRDHATFQKTLLYIRYSLQVPEAVYEEVDRAVEDEEDVVDARQEERPQRPLLVVLLWDIGR